MKNTKLNNAFETKQSVQILMTAQKYMAIRQQVTELTAQKAEYSDLLKAFLETQPGKKAKIGKDTFNIQTATSERFDIKMARVVLGDDAVREFITVSQSNKLIAKKGK